MPIIAFCEECGKKYIFEEEDMEDRTIRIECSVCGEINIVTDKDVKVISPEK